jgi:hypothetical protein
VLSGGKLSELRLVQALTEYGKSGWFAVGFKEGSTWNVRCFALDVHCSTWNIR